MSEKQRRLGKVKITQLQPSGLIINTPQGYIYDPTRRLEVPKLKINQKGIEAENDRGEKLLDIHHANHPDTHLEGDNAISIGFTSHYDQMRSRFGDHMQDGVAGENIIIELDELVWIKDLGQKIAFQNPDTGENVYLDVLKFAAPCDEFSHFAANRINERMPAEELKATLQFLGDGRRGFLLKLSDNQESATIMPGDLVFSVDA